MQSVVERLVGRMGLPGSVVSIKLNELIHCGKILAGKNRGKESFKLPDDDNDGDSDTSSDAESEELEDDSHSSVDLDPTFSGKRFQSGSTDPTTHMPSKQQAHAATMVTLFLGILKKHNFRDTINPMCISNDGIEDTEHFLLLCPSFDTQRRDLAGVLALVRPFGLSKPSNEVLTQLLMYGNKDFPDEINRNILELTLRFIHETGRFD